MCIRDRPPTLPQEPGTLREKGRAHIFAIASDGDRSQLTPLKVTEAPVADQVTSTAFETALATVAGGSATATKAVVNWGDGSPVDRVTIDGGSVKGSHTYAAAGTYRVSVTATDGVRSATATTSIAVTAPPAYTPSLTAPSGTVRPGSTVAVTGTGFAPTEKVDLALGGATPVEVTTDGNGAFSASLTIPGDAVDGTYPITAVGKTSRAEASAQVIVAAAPVAQATTVTLAPGPDAVVGAPLTLTATLSPATAAGQVVFREGDTVVGSASVSGGVAHAEVVPATAGEHAYVAVFTPDDPTLFTGSQSETLTVAVAAAPTTGAPQLTLSSASVVQGGSVTVTVIGLAAGERVRFELHSDPIVLGSAVADAQGTVRASVTIPRSAPTGTHTVVAIAATSPESSAALTVTAADSGNHAGTGPLGSTGGTIPVGLIVAAIVLLVSGVVLTAVRRRRGHRAANAPSGRES